MLTAGKCTCSETAQTSAMIGVFPSSLRAAAFRAHSGAVWQSSGKIRFLSIFWCATQQILPISLFQTGSLYITLAGC